MPQRSWSVSQAPPSQGLAKIYSACLCAVAFNSVEKNLSHSLFKSAEWEEGWREDYQNFCWSSRVVPISPGRRSKYLMHRTFMVANLLIPEFPRKIYRLSPSSWTLLKRYEIISGLAKKVFPLFLSILASPQWWHVFWRFSEKAAIPLLLHPRIITERVVVEDLDVVPKTNLGLDCLIHSRTSKELCSTNFTGFCPIT